MLDSTGSLLDLVAVAGAPWMAARGPMRSVATQFGVPTASDAPLLAQAADS
ncbi:MULTISPECIES: hypothetical protein [unclassified Nocardiopsis]|uniref:hypothetical protein n=1 Tax=unclassified Nocardiopsis TaxID=2649073 RepID=UPI0018FEAAB0|nr:hypothetical protein [Nocardiopsis sp. TSRI0078]